MTAPNESRIAVHRSPESCAIIVYPGGGAGEWAFIVTLFVPLVAIVAVVVHLVRRIPSSASPWNSAGPLIATLVGLLMVLGVLRMMLATLWSLFGREEILVNQEALSVRRVIGPIRWGRDFRLAEVSNVRWRERRVVAKGRTYFRKVVSFDAQNGTTDLGTHLSFVEATEVERELRAAIDTLRQ